MSKRPDCYECKYRGTIPGDAHTRCKHPKRGTLKIKGHPGGIKGGWFSWPGNFDPIWLLECDGFQPDVSNSNDDPQPAGGIDG